MTRMAIVAALVMLLVQTSCGDRNARSRPELYLYAAASLRDVLNEVAPRLEGDCGVDLVFQFGSSGDLARQIRAAGKADVFFSAGEREMDDLVASGLVLVDTRTDFLSNHLVVIEPIDEASAFSGPFTAALLTGPGVERLALANVLTVPSGRYAKAWLESAGVWSAVEARVLPCVDARAALAAVEAGAAPIGIVYATDAAQSKRVRVAFVVPALSGPRIAYPLAALGRRPHEDRARAMVAALGSRSSREAFARHGFLVAGSAAAR